MKYTDLMLDLETMGNNPRSPIASIGAIAFDIVRGANYPGDQEFYINVDIQSCLDLGLVPDGSTIYWWLGQSESARQSLVIPSPVHITEAYSDLCNFILGTTYPKYRLWSHSTFDPVILRSAADLLHQPLPFIHKQPCDIRTLSRIAEVLDIKAEVKQTGTSHNALDDARFQVEQVRQLYQGIMWL